MFLIDERVSYQPRFVTPSRFEEIQLDLDCTFSMRTPPDCGPLTLLLIKASIIQVPVSPYINYTYAGATHELAHPKIATPDAISTDWFQKSSLSCVKY